MIGVIFVALFHTIIAIMRGILCVYGFAKLQRMERIAIASRDQISTSIFRCTDLGKP